MKDFLKRLSKEVSNFLEYAEKALPLYLILGLTVAATYYSITAMGKELRDKLLDKPYENTVSTTDNKKSDDTMASATANKKSDDNTLTTIEFISTGQVRIITGVGSTKTNKLWSVIYDKVTKLVYLYNQQSDTYIPYMKDKTTQYTWDIKSKQLE